MTDPLDKTRSVVITTKPRYAIDDHDDNIVSEERSSTSEVANVNDSTDDTSTYVRSDHEEGIWFEDETCNANRKKKASSYRLMARKKKRASSPRDEEALIECENRRGRTVLKLVGNAIRKGIKLPLEWNRNKVPVGDNKDYFASYIGIVVRERVNINYTAWDEVPKEVINEVYDHITNTVQQQEDGAWPEHENVTNSNQVSRRLEGVQEGGFGGSQGLGGMLGSMSDQRLQGANFQLASKQNKVQVPEVQTEVYHVAWPDPEKEYVPETEFVLSTEQVNDQPFPQVTLFC
ncbi:hypothetical protein SOVF_064310 [Spinacia oleracea]|nr:hypothetical protein SOVF_064310 [Spinacia oleracea]